MALNRGVVGMSPLFRTEGFSEHSNSKILLRPLLRLPKSGLNSEVVVIANQSYIKKISFTSIRLNSSDIILFAHFSVSKSYIQTQNLINKYWRLIVSEIYLILLILRMIQEKWKRCTAFPSFLFIRLRLLNFSTL